MRQVALVALIAVAIALGLAGTLKANPPAPKFRPSKESTVTTTYTTPAAVPAQAVRAQAVHVQSAPRVHAAQQVFVPTAQFVPVYAQPVARQAVFVPVQAPRLREVAVDPCLPTALTVPATDGLPTGVFVPPQSAVGFTPGAAYQHTETHRQTGRFLFGNRR